MTVKLLLEVSLNSSDVISYRANIDDSKMSDELERLLVERLTGDCIHQLKMLSGTQAGEQK